MSSKFPWQETKLRYLPESDYYETTTNEVVPGASEQLDGFWALLINCPGGQLMPAEAAVLTEILSDGGLGLKFTGRQAPLLQLPAEKVPAALEKLKAAGLKIAFLHKSLRNVKACVGSKGCKNSRSYDVLETAKKIDKRFYGIILPWDFKIAVSGCSRNCASATCQSLGLIETAHGFDLYLGGSEAAHPQHGFLAASGIPEEKILNTIEGILKWYVFHAKELVKKGQLHQRPHFYEVIKKVGRDLLVEAVAQCLGDNPSGQSMLPASPALSEDTERLPGFNKENVFHAFMTLSKLCNNCSPCKKHQCQLFIAKETLSNAARTGKKFVPGIPRDVINILHSLPLPPDKFEQFKLMDAYHNIAVVCDLCNTPDHDPLCSVNVALTAIGCLINGRDFTTGKDREQHEAFLL